MDATASLQTDPPRLFRIATPHNRRRVRSFIQHCFAEEYAAAIDVYSRHLIALLDGQDVQAAVGYQSAAEGPLFLEQYLEQPIEHYLARHAGGPVARERILEMGNLASHSSGWTRHLILHLAGFLHRQGFEWVVMTATPRVLNSFHKLGIGAALIPLTPADPARLKEGAGRWGRYYEEHPLVLAAHVRRGLAQLRRCQRGALPVFDAATDRQLKIVS
ncbi:thermostable hemolysin [Motiliproteus sp. SC1-56]|uniref:thermostable hemolysin n=1 Tax=Motiliproteus sp. SC1-56 TaxID=2799565 RepID=UPI001A8D78FF|nr:thermostable hemolysin [Motiliproteus sp. SC1-56]